ncbi:MAG: ribose 5-phosphate isomerase B [Candidatus Gracilibacteria bacterium]|jgi:ribose 5-phosphate isomerase B
MKVYIGADHAGFPLKEILREHIKGQGHEVIDLGTFNEDSVDYPDLAREVGEKVRENRESRGVLVCGTGIGVAIAANKLKGIRAANVHDRSEAELSRKHNNANIVTIGGRVMDEDTAKGVVDIFLSTAFEGGRHEARIAKITAIENEE